jgi:hypothetical protein
MIKVQRNFTIEFILIVKSSLRFDQRQIHSVREDVHLLVSRVQRIAQPTMFMREIKVKDGVSQLIVLEDFVEV